MIPKNIFQTWKTKKISSELKKITNTWKINNSSYEYYFYDDRECEFFIKDNFDKDVFYAYKKIIPGAFKADLWRVCMLYKFGGFYCDLDTICLGSIDNFVNEKTKFIAPVDLNNECSTGHNLFNSFIGSVKNSEVMKFCIERITHNAHNNITDIPALDFSACGVLGRSLNNYLNFEETSSFLGKEGTQFGSDIVLLKFEGSNEIVGDIFGNSLFQNKHKHKKTKEAYEKQCNMDNVKSWFNSEKWLENKKFI